MNYRTPRLFRRGLKWRSKINGNYARHCKAAREIAEEYFDSDKVLKKLLEDLGLE